ncbi:FUSC family protein [Fodinibius sediminis]|uniref:TIGR01666 family membrane protein n=1 Tax=Fodinibius sediminis TaxID=1214077 RepID=A0A521F646_9BACT|nr:FUSC family membrane protein [Fodinibius sediminis]SMO91566.1 TIGR01666 family membrane protein [Fodinibius sediminis]
MTTPFISRLRRGIAYLQEVFRDEQFYLSLRHTVGAFIPLVVCELIGYETLGLELMLGAFFVSAVDIAGTLRSKATALLITTAISITITFCILVVGNNLLMLPLLFLFIFGLAYISPFSLRYTLMAVMGYIAIILAISMVGRFSSIEGILWHCFLLLCGSLWYFVFAMVIHWFARTREINRRIAECTRQTAQYFQQRLALLEPGTNHEQGLLELARLQQQLSETQESARELLFSDTSLLAGRSSERRRFYLIFIELVDMHELAVATPIDYPRIRELLHRYPEYNIIRSIIARINREMHNLADILLHNADYAGHLQLGDNLDQLRSQLQELKEQVLKEESTDEEAYHALRRIELYLHRQLQKVEVIQNAVLNRKTYEEKDVQQATATEVDTKDLPQFVTPNPLNWNSVLGNFSFESSYFRYALRTATTAVAGYALAGLLQFQNAYWVLLTVLVVMKPGYGVTRERFYHRIIGTLIGALIAYGIYQLNPSHTISLALFGVALTLAFTFVVHNYTVASTFFTIFVIFLYSFLNREIPSMVVFRVVDTLLGAVLVILAIRYLWPYWEHQKFPALLRKSLCANKAYLQKVLKHLFEGTFHETEYRLARKKAYVDMANLVSSYYRLTGDPESKQKNAKFSYDLALLSYMILSTTTSLGIFVQRHRQQAFDYQEFRLIGDGIITNLDFSISELEQATELHKAPSEISKSEDIEQAGDDLEQQLRQLKQQLKKQPTDQQNQTYVKYAQINYLSQQLGWMLELSRTIAKHVKRPG